MIEAAEELRERMRSKTVAQLLIKLGVAKSHSRPYTPTDNPFSEAQFKTMKSPAQRAGASDRPDYPQAFAGMEHARGWAREFIHWYNHEHHHAGLALMTPATVHYGQVETVYEQRQQVLGAAYAAHPERFVHGKPTPPKPSEEIWINQPESEHKAMDLAGPAASDREPGAQAASRAKSAASLDTAEHRAIMERSLDQPDVMGFFLPKFAPELSQSH